VAGFLGSANLLAAEVAGVGPGGVTCRSGGVELLIDTQAAVHPGDRVDLLLRPERLQLSPRSTGSAGSAVNRLVARVQRLAFRGAQTQVTLLVAEVSLVADVPNVHGEVPTWLHEGSEVLVEVSPAAIRLLGTVPAAGPGQGPDPVAGSGDRSGQAPQTVSDEPPNVAAGTSS
jgi:ABC-type Fe3+/spermidine/putrescine transport system ATPase subunit